LIAERQVHNGALLALTWSSDGRCILSTSEDGSIKLWDVDCRCLPDEGMDNRVNSGKISLLFELQLTPTASVALAATFFPSRMSDRLTNKPFALIAGISDGSVKLWSPDTSKRRVPLY
jgi:WD40 repeat protein